MVGSLYDNRIPDKYNIIASGILSGTDKPLFGGWGGGGQRAGDITLFRDSGRLHLVSMPKTNRPSSSSIGDNSSGTVPITAGSDNEKGVTPLFSVTSVTFVNTIGM